MTSYRTRTNWSLAATGGFLLLTGSAAITRANNETLALYGLSICLAGLAAIGTLLWRLSK